MKIRAATLLAEKTESVRIHYDRSPMDLPFKTYEEAFDSLKRNLVPGEWQHYSIVVTKSLVKTYKFSEGR